MLNENQNKMDDWKSRLDCLDQLPAELPANSGALWDKLSTRLADKPAKKKWLWYWAAACILIVFSVSFIRYLTVTFFKPAPNNSLALHTKKIVAPPPNTGTIVSTTPSVLITPVIPHKNTSSIKTVKTWHPAVTPKIPMLTAYLPANQLANTPPMQVAAPLALSDSSALTILSTPLKKKLKIVHINEIQSVDEHPDYAVSNAMPRRFLIFGQKSPNYKSISQLKKISGNIAIYIPSKK